MVGRVCVCVVLSLLEEREVVLYCDLHGHSRHQNIFIYGCENRSDPQRRLQERVFPYMLSRNAPDMFNYKNCRFHVQKDKEGTGRVVVWNMGIQNSYTLEVSSGGGKGRRRGASAPGGTVQVTAFGGAKIWNSEIWPLLTNWRLQCRTHSAGSLV